MYRPLIVLGPSGWANTPGDGVATGSSSGPTTGSPSPARAPHPSPRPSTTALHEGRGLEAHPGRDRPDEEEDQRHPSTRRVGPCREASSFAGAFRPSGVSSAPPTLQPDAAPLVSTVVGATMPVMVPVTGPIAAAAPGVDLAPDYGCRQDGDPLQCSFHHCASLGSPRRLMYGAPRRWLRASYGETVHLGAEILVPRLFANSGQAPN